MKAIGFDYDGTLTNIEPEKAQAFAETLSREWNVNVKEAEEYWLSQGGTSRKFKFDYFYKKRFGKEIPDNVYKEVESKFSKLLKEEYYPDIKLLPHINEVLGYSQNNFDFVFIASGVPEKEIKYLVDLNKINRYFDIVLGTNDVYKSKKDHLDEIRKTKNPSLLIFVGDSAEDMRVAKLSGAIAVGLITNHPSEKLKEAGADYACSLEDVQSTLKKIIS